MILILVAGWFTPLYLDRFRPERSGLLLFKMRGIYNLAVNRFWLDEFYDVAVVQPTTKLGRLLDRLDTGLIDRATGIPAPPSRIHTAVETWEEQRLASQAVGAVGPAGELTALPSTWEEEEEREEKAGVVGGATGVLGWLTKTSGDTTGWVEREGIGHVTGAVGWLTGVFASISTWVEREIIVGAERLVAWLTEAIAALSARAERLIFHTGVNVGVPWAGSLLGRVLTRTEEALGRPLVIGSILLVSLVALMVRAV